MIFCPTLLTVMILNPLAWVSTRAHVLNSARGIPHSRHARPGGDRDYSRGTRRGL